MHCYATQLAVFNCDDNIMGTLFDMAGLKRHDFKESECLFDSFVQVSQSELVG